MDERNNTDEENEDTVVGQRVNRNDAKGCK